ncbi:bifunctional DNA-formamidopyrimidine glycosylase/DNA-(apurinic or apyrimidinic site) lyase [Orrella sp. JC864]|uniref:bifunctional DNA-formamidopyrimidine glycosylase/DNA-(apurinic or apyrimidinic site) lyase n=1 Tax=Orrella sp. JC864 TaxID=3120298 RepID=UPI0012BD7CC6
MPELPEVETTRRGIAPLVTGRALTRLAVHEPRLRWPVPADMDRLLAGRTLLACERRGKYLLLRFEHGVQLVHLGMSGSLRRVAPGEFLRKHDHVEWVFGEDAVLRLHDPRRFGAVLWHPAEAGPVQDHPLLARLGIEPFDPRFGGAWLRAWFKGRSQSVKQALLAGDAVVGVGNIYASESLFRARIHPATPAGRLSPARCERLAQAVQATLQDALHSGGSTLRDYVNSDSEPGAYFDIHAAVYERAGLPCKSCATPIRRIVQGQRATYYCPRCQRA